MAEPWTWDLEWVQFLMHIVLDLRKWVRDDSEHYDSILERSAPLGVQGRAAGDLSRLRFRLVD